MHCYDKVIHIAPQDPKHLKLYKITINSVKKQLKLLNISLSAKKNKKSLFPLTAK
jgi:hypothetical protein